MFRYLHMLTMWCYPHSPAARHVAVCHAAISWYLLSARPAAANPQLAGPTAANLQQWICCCGPRHTDQWTQMDTWQVHRSCSALWAGSARNVQKWNVWRVVFALLAGLLQQARVHCGTGTNEVHDRRLLAHDLGAKHLSDRHVDKPHGTWTSTSSCLTLVVSLYS